jgi:hypothetical protein
MDVINRSTFGTVDRAFPVPKTIWIKVVNGVTGLSLKIFFTPDYITHSSHLLLYPGLFIPSFNLAGWIAEQFVVNLDIVSTHRPPDPV